MRIRTVPALTAAVLVVVGGTAGGYVATRSGHEATTGTPPVSLASPTASRSPVLPTASPTASPATSAGTTAVLARAATNPLLGGELAGLVVTADSDSTVFSRSATRPRPPASTAKLLTAAAALQALGPDARLTTSVMRAGATVYLVGGGDVTLTRTPQPTTYPTPAALSDLAARTAAAIGRHAKVRVATDSTAWSGPKRARGWSANYFAEGDIAAPAALELDEGRLSPGTSAAPRVQDPVLQAGDAFADLLRRDRVRVVGRPRPVAAPAQATTIAHVDSPPIAALVQRMLTVSDNDLAEALGRAVADHDRLPATYAGAAAAITARMRALGVPAGGLRLNDASGLSRDDRVTAADLVRVLRAATSRPTLQPILAGLPIAGFTGTLADRYRTASMQAAAGVLRAKTGTLRGVNTLAGVVRDRSGQLLVFAFLADHAALPAQTEGALDDLAARLARCGCA